MRGACLLLVAILAGCATQIDHPPPATAVKVSVPCTALGDVPEAPQTTPDDTLKVLGATCKRTVEASCDAVCRIDADRACARVVYLINLDRKKVIDWLRIAQVAIESCKK